MVTITSYAGSLATKLDEYKKFGQREATKHRPPTDATHPDTHEVELQFDAERHVANEQALFNAQVADADRSALDVRQKVRDLETATELALAEDALATEVEAELASDRRALVQAAEARIAAEVDWRGFRSLNGITATAAYPDSVIWHWAVIFALAFVETVANAFFYENAQGLLGGFVVAAGVAAVNMGTAVLLGNQFRRKNLRATEQRVAGWACLPLFVVLTLFCNALFASFRSVYQLLDDPADPAQLSDAFRQAWAEAGRLFILDMDFGDFTSFLLFMTGIVLSCIAFWKGYTSDDPHPGYSDKDRRLKAAKAEEARLQERSKQKLKDFLVSRRTQVQGLASQPMSLVSVLHGRASQVEHAERALLANAAAIQRDYHLVLDAYRQANLAVRGVDPPTYFAERPEVAHKVTTVLARPALEEIEATVAAVTQFRQRYQDGLNAKLNQLQERMSAILSDTFARFLNEVEVEAKAKVQSGNMIMPGAAL